MESLSKEEARKIVDRIRKDNGGISAAEREQLLELMPQAVDMIETLRRKLGAATKSVALSLYSKETRFMYELFQNADDNSYSVADDRNELRFINFFLYPDHLIVDSNEDGFRIKDIEAICSTAESSKKAEGYIGEKGIGFKSVFKVASKAHIQSGPFSFFFQYDKEHDENGLGMVTPFNDEHEDLPEGVRTRITLSLLQNIDFELHQREFNSVPSALLLFLNKLETFKVSITDATGATVATQYKWSSGKRKETITKETTAGSVATIEKNSFYVKRKAILEMPGDKDRQHSDQVTVILGFPVDEEENPIIKHQQVYAFLPLRSFGFTFLIQADFITQASREDVFHSPWNARILEGIADTFLQAVRDFCVHPKLRYSWLQYLPSESIADDFWKRVRSLIHNRLKNSPILLPQTGTNLKKPHRLRIVPADYMDDDGVPLFADADKELYISPKYGIDSFKTLRWLGVISLTASEFLDFVERDLKQTSSRLKSEVPESGWSSKVVRCVLRILDTDSQLRERVKRIPLIPIEGKRIVGWLSAPRVGALFGSTGLTALIYFPIVGKAVVPTDLPLNCVHSSWMKNKAWNELFKRLGVEHCDPKMVLAKISERYDKKTVGSITFEQSLSHLVFCYWHSRNNLPKDLYLIDHQQKIFDPTLKFRGWIYIPQSTDMYSPCCLFPEGRRYPGFSYMGFKLRSIDERYYRQVPIEQKLGEKKWDEWLNESFDIKTYLQLFDRTFGNSLSTEFLLICKFQPEMLLGILRKNWIEYDPFMVLETKRFTQNAVEVLRDTEVPCRGDMKKELCKAYLPLDAICSNREKFHVPNLPILELPASFTGGLIEGWGFLARFGVGMDDDLRFFIDVLLHFTKNDIASDSNIDLALLKELYKMLRIKCSAAEQEIKLREVFQTQAVIWMPSIEDSAGRWLTSKDCVWSCPPWMTVKKRLSNIYKGLEGFFHFTLNIQNADLSDSLEELSTLSTRSVGGNERHKIKEIYHDIWNHARQDLDSVSTTVDTIVSSFQEYNLIYTEQGTSVWNSITSCIWAESRIRIPGKLSIASEYSDLEEFFVHIIKVPKPDIRMHVEALKQLSKRDSSVLRTAEEVKTMMRNITAFNPTSNDVKGLRKAECFPVTSADGRVSWADSTSGFAIADRVEYQQVFRNKISILDFTMSEIHSVGPFLIALGLKSQFMSNCVEEASNVAGGTPDPDLTSKMRKKASACYRCAAHFYSDKVTQNHDLYNTLQDVIVYTSDGISKSMTITQNGKNYSVEHSKANFHLEEDSDTLLFYVPRDEQQREVCYLRQLPAKFSGYLGLSNPKAEAIVKEIVNSSSLFVVDEILNDAGIVDIPSLNQTQTREELGSGLGFRFQEAVDRVQSTQGAQSSTSPTLVPEEDSDEEVVATARLQATTRSPRPQTDHYEAYAGRDSQSERRDDVGGARTAYDFSGPSSQFPASRSVDQPYIDLLDYILDVQKDCTFPAFGTSRLLDRTPRSWPSFNVTTSVSAPTRFQTNCKIGAAGELFVFKMLSSMSLPGFGVGNWRSNIRNYVSVHSDFSTLTAWGESETSDIVYDDIEGVLTKTLIQKGYLDAAAWENRKPEYLLEVKTTKGWCHEPFYISQNQFNLMQQYALGQGPQNHVYMILRLFRLGAVGMGLKVYLDPESLRRDGALVFTPESYKVEVRSE